MTRYALECSRCDRTVYTSRPTPQLAVCVDCRRHEAWQHRAAKGDAGTRDVHRLSVDAHVGGLFSASTSPERRGQLRGMTGSKVVSESYLPRTDLPAPMYVRSSSTPRASGTGRHHPTNPPPPDAA